MMTDPMTNAIDAVRLDASHPPAAAAAWPTNRQRLLGAIALLSPLLLWLIYAWTLPFNSTIAHSGVPIRGLNVHQKLNIQKAACKIDGFVLKPGQVFSFNSCVGPRTPARGYYDAPSYIWDGNYGTTGGGICVVSSALYQAALLAGLKIAERVPHLRTMQTVSPGLDATVWYGGADLKITNSTKKPIQLSCKSDGASLLVAILGPPELCESTNYKVWRHESMGSDRRVSVEVYRQDADHKTELISRDLYEISSPTRKPVESGAVKVSRPS
jgi:vancomycin resistance protein YoaR